MGIFPEPFLELLAGEAASSHVSAVGAKFPAGDPKNLAAAAYARGHTRIACASEHPVATVSTTPLVSAEAYRNRLDNGRPPNESFRFVVVVIEGR
jgi:hypothetical protein